VVWGSAGVLSAIVVLVEADYARRVPAELCSDAQLGLLGSPSARLVAVLVVATVVQTAALVVAYRVTTSLVSHRLAAAVTVTAVGSCLLVLLGWGLFAVLGLPVSHGDIGLYPDWWPDWLPPSPRVMPCRFRE